MTTFNDCPSSEDPDQAAKYWFFLLRHGILQDEFGLSLESSTEDEEESGAIELLFCVDTTGSMTQTIKNVSRALGAFIHELSQLEAGIALGMITLGDEVPYRTKVDLSTDYGALAVAVDSLTAEGGGDTRENQLDAITSAAELFTEGSKHAICLISDVNYHVAGDRGGSKTTATIDNTNYVIAQHNAHLFVICSPLFYDQNYYGDPSCQPDPLTYNKITSVFLGNINDDITGLLTNDLVQKLKAL